MRCKRRGNWTAAVAEYREATRLNPDLSEAHYNLGIALRGKGDLDGAQTEIRRALRIKPFDHVLHDGLATVLKEKGDLVGAVAEYREAFRLSRTTILHAATSPPCWLK